MELASSRIQARSRHQAMDWSLVLVSQGIETIIEFVPEDRSWGLRVSDTDYDRARESIRQYRLENRRWPWRREIPGGILFDWTSIAWVLLLAFFFWVSETRADLRSAGAMDSVAVGNGQVWRLFTAIWLHADLAHLAANATIGFVLLGLSLGRYGTGLGLLAAILTGAGGNLLAYLVDSAPHRSLGASGLVMGCLGLLAVQSFLVWRRPPFVARHVLLGVFAGLMLFVLLGLSPGTDVLAHLGGFLTGLVLGACCSLAPVLTRKPVANLSFGALFLAGVVWPWFMALTGAN